MPVKSGGVASSLFVPVRLFACLSYLSVGLCLCLCLSLLLSLSLSLSILAGSHCHVFSDWCVCPSLLSSRVTWLHLSRSPLEPFAEAGDDVNGAPLRCDAKGGCGRGQWAPPCADFLLLHLVLHMIIKEARWMRTVIPFHFRYNYSMHSPKPESNGSGLCVATLEARLILQYCNKPA